MSATLPPIEISLKPRVLIADDSRIVRATLIKHIQGMFEFSEALDGEQAWEMLLLDPNIRVLITDLTMPRLDGYGLLQRIRASEIGRIREMPVVVVSGSDEKEERDRAKAAGATDLITKGMGTAQLLSRLDILSKLVSTQREYEKSLELLIKNGLDGPAQLRSSPFTFHTQVEAMLAYATRHSKNLVLFNIRVGLQGAPLSEGAPVLPADVITAIGLLLQGSIRQSDWVAKTGETEFTLATSNINLESARGFAGRLCRAISSASLMADKSASVVASCGVASLCEHPAQPGSVSPTLNALWEIAYRRSTFGMRLGHTGAIDAAEEDRLRQSLQGIATN